MNAGPRFSPWLGSVLAGLLLILAFEPFGWYGCGWVALAPAWIALRGSTVVRRSPLRYGYVVGLMFILGCFWWVGAVTFAGIAIMAVMLSFYPALWFLLMARVPGLPGDGRKISFRALVGYALLAAAFWVTLEWLRSWFMKGFNWNELGVSQVPCLHLRQLAALGGVPLLSFALVAFSVFIGEAIWSVWHRWWRPAGFAALGAVVLLGASWGYGWQRLQRQSEELPQTSLSYACIQPNIPEVPYEAGNKAQILQAELAAMNLQQDLSVQAVNDNPSLLIWPEAVTMQRLENGSMISQVIDHLEAFYPGSILLGSEEYVQGKIYNSAFLLGPDHASVQRYRKVYLVIFGEYLPGTDLFPWLNKLWSRGISATAGTEPGHLVLAREKLSLAPLICFEDTQPRVVNAAAALRPDFFVTLINAGWFEGPPGSWCLPQHLENSVLRCVEHDRPMICCADTGITCEIDMQGNVVAELPFQPGVSGAGGDILSRELILYPWTPTPYERWGDWLGVLSRWATLGICAACLLVKRKIFNPRTLKKEGNVA